MLNPVTHVLPLTNIQRRRYLPVAGTVLVRVGQMVKADEVIAQADLYSKHISLNVARGLGVAKGKIADYMKRKIGDDIPQNGIIASKPGLMERVIRAPQAGKLVAVGGGQVLLQVSHKPFDLLASIPGKVFQIEADYGATIQASGAWIQGVWGNGKIGVGGLVVAVKTAEDVMKVSELDPSYRGQVLFGGHCNNPDVLETLAQYKMRGLILGSIATRLIPAANRMPYAIMVLEGFGQIPVNLAVFKLLSTSGQREISINAAVYNRETGDRPEAIIPLPGSDSQPSQVNLEMVTVGKQVHLLRAPYIGQTGTVSAMMGFTKMPNGLQTEAVEVTLSNEEKAIVPLANIEILG